MSESSLGERFRAMLESRPVQEIGGELRRLGVQGSLEMANVLCGSGQAFMPYGPGQWPTAEREGAQPEQQHEQHQEQSRGMSM